MKITATFKGRDGSMGFTKYVEYTLNVSKSEHGVTTIYTSTGLNCDYGSVYSFLENWDNIVKVK